MSIEKKRFYNLGAISIVALVAVIMLVFLFKKNAGSAENFNENEIARENQRKTASKESERSASRSTSRASSSSGAKAPDHQDIVALIADDPEAAYHHLLSIKNTLKTEEYEVYQAEALLKWALLNPEAACLVYDDVDSYLIRESLMKGLAQGWAAKDISKAFTWLETNSEQMSKNQMTAVYSIIMKNYASQNPAEAAQLVSQLSPDLQYRLLNNVTSEYAKKDFNEALEWTLTHQTQELKDSGLTQLIFLSNGEDSKAMLETVMAEQDSLSLNTVSAAFGKMALVDPAVAIEHLDSVDPKALSATISLFTGSWLKADPVAAIEWVSAQGEGEVFDTGAERIASATFYADPAKALQWASKVSSSEKRIELLTKYIGYAEENQFESIKSGIDQLNIPEHELAIIRDKFDEVLESVNQTIVIPN